jgi:hypothetical protein
MTAVYEPAGVKGTAASTENVRKSAYVYFGEFLATKLLPAMKDLTIGQVTEGLLREFGTYLILFAHKKKGDKKLLMSGTAVDYLGHVFTFFSLKFPANDYFKKGATWYKEVRYDVQRRIDNRQIANGEPTSEKSRELGRKLLRVICDAFLKLGDPISMKRRFALVTTFLAIGRSAEISCCVWDQAEWDYELECLLFYWNELKTTDSDLTTMFSDAELVELDFYHSLGFYLILGGDVSAQRKALQNKFMIPSLSLNKKGAADVMTTSTRAGFKACDEPEYQAIADDFECTSLR